MCMCVCVCVCVCACVRACVRVHMKGDTHIVAMNETISYVR